MIKEIHFKYKSIGNFVKLLTTIMFEKTQDAREISIWHQRFDNDESDDLFEKFLYELYPEGKFIQLEDINIIMNYAKQFLDKDELAQGFRNDYIKMHSKNWVYFKIDNIVYPCEFAQHQKTITEICIDFFKDFEDVDLEYLQNFILNNFEIQSNNSTIQSIARDAGFIKSEIIYNYWERSENRCSQTTKTEE